MAEVGLFEAMYSARALRRYKPDGISDEIITRILDAAIRAPSGRNQQNWVFIVVKDAERRRRIGEIYRKAGDLLLKTYATRERPKQMNDRQYHTLLTSAGYLFGHMHEAPVQLFACLRTAGATASATNQPSEVAPALPVRMSGSSIYPAVQNIILACRAFGIGTVLTTIHSFFEDEVRALLALAPEIQTYALLPMGYPINKFGPVKRRPVSEVAFLDQYGNNWKA